MRRFIVTTLIAAVVGGVAPVAGAARADPDVARVLILVLPGVTWQDLSGGDLQTLRGFLDGAAVADLSTRAPRLRNDLAGNYASLGAGDKAVGASVEPEDAGVAPAGAAYGVDEVVGDALAGDLFERRSGHAAGNGVVMLGLDRLVEANARTAFDAEVGRFGAALGQAGWRRAVIANGDGAAVAGLDPTPRRMAVSALMDRAGRVPAGRLDAELLVADRSAAFGRRLDADAVEWEFATAWRPRSVVLVEASDLVRAETYRDLHPGPRAEALRDEALAATDAVAARLLDHVDPARDAVVVVGTAPAPAHGRLAVAAVRAPGVRPGLLRSGTTQRTGFVQMMDLAPSVLRLVGADVPDTMRGRSMQVAASSSGPAERVAFLMDADRAAAFRARIQPGVASLMLAMTIVMVVLGLLALRSPNSSVAAATAEWWALVTLAFLPVVYLARLVPFHDFAPGWFWATLGVGSVALAAAARRAGRAYRLGPTALLLAVVWIVLAADVALGSPLQFNGALGFSPEVAGRFVGFGNAGFAIFAAAALLLAVIVAPAGRRGRGAALAVLAATVVVDGSPFLGADVGGVLTLVSAFGLVAWRITGRRLRLRTVVAMVGGALVAVGVAALVDLARPVGSRTHLGRLVEQIRREGVGEFVDVIVRKVGLNLASWSSSPYRWLLPVVVAGAVLAIRIAPEVCRGAWRRLDFQGSLTVGMPVLVVLGYALNDTGVLVPVLMGMVAMATLMPLVTDPEAMAEGGRTRWTVRFGRAPASA